jgi:hypothetical protein
MNKSISFEEEDALHHKTTSNFDSKFPHFPSAKFYSEKVPLAKRKIRSAKSTNLKEKKLERKI